MTVVSDVAAAGRAPSVVTVGFFDGVHRGHQAIVGRACELADGRRVVAVTFDRHPQEVLAPGSQPKYLMSLERRVRTLLELGPDVVVVLPFTLEFSRWSPAQFVQQVLLDGLDARTVVVGRNFRFGHGAVGTVATLRELLEPAGIGVEAVELLELDGTPISSTEIRARLRAGDVRWATAALGRPYWLDGVVVRGEGRGRRIGIPTANLEVDHRLLVPARGVYACWAEGSEARWPAVANIGVRPTFGGEVETVEAHLIGARDLDLYGVHLSLGFVARLREERRFADADELVAQIRSDIDRAAELLGST